MGRKLARADNNAGIGLARAEVSINNENDDVIGLAQAGAWTNNAFPLANFWFTRSRFDLLARDAHFQYPPLQIAKTWGECSDYLNSFWKPTCWIHLFALP